MHKNVVNEVNSEQLSNPARYPTRTQVPSGGRISYVIQMLSGVDKVSFFVKETSKKTF